MLEKCDYCVFIARLQPPHNAHIKIIKKALKTAKEVIIVFGSHRAAPNIKNPWSADQRKEMVLRCFEGSDALRLHFINVRDYYYNDMLWITEVGQKVREIIGDSYSVKLIGHFKDSSSYYLKLFPQWGFVETGSLDEGLNATQIRESYFGEDLWTPEEHAEFDWRTNIPTQIVNWLEDFKHTNTYRDLAREYKFITEYKKKWETAPFPPTFVTTDVVVFKMGQVLLVRRKGNPGKGCLALPGGFINPNEWIVDSAIRELKEETKIDIAPKELKKHISQQQVFDHPNRSLRGRTVTHAFCIKLPDDGRALPKVKGSDDAEHARWIPIGDLTLYENEFYEDHMHIINRFLGLY